MTATADDVTRFAKILVRKARSALDRPFSWLEVREARTELRAPLTYPERNVIRELGHLLDRDGIVVHDVGAATGVYTSAFAKVSAVGRVCAFEPAAAAFEALVQRVAPFSHVSCYEFALGDTNGRRTLHEYSYSDVSSLLPMEDRQARLLPPATQRVERTIEVRRLDDLVADGVVPPPDLLKIDVQGSEESVLRGAEAALRHARCCVVEMTFVSMYEGSWLFDDIYEHLKARGFVLSAVAGPIAGPLGQSLFVDGVFRRAS